MSKSIFASMAIWSVVMGTAVAGMFYDWAWLSNLGSFLVYLYAIALAFVTFMVTAIYNKRDEKEEYFNFLVKVHDSMVKSRVLVYSLDIVTVLILATAGYTFTAAFLSVVVLLGWSVSISIRELFADEQQD